jgi:hypothetical protein
MLRLKLGERLYQTKIKPQVETGNEGNGIFEAAGFESYCIQELRGLVDIFREKEGTWAGIAQNEWYKENPQLLPELPANLKSQEFNLEVSDHLRQLSIALKRNNFAE